MLGVYLTKANSGFFKFNVKAGAVGNYILAVDRSNVPQYSKNNIKDFAYGLNAGIGLEFQFGSIENYWLLIAIILVSFASKITGGYVGGRLAGLSSSTSLTLGVGLNARGIMELVIANIAYKSGLINIEIFSILVVMGLFTTLVTPLLLKKSFGLEDKEVAKKSIL